MKSSQSLLCWHYVTTQLPCPRGAPRGMKIEFTRQPAVPSAVTYGDVQLRRESSMEECRKTSGIQVPDEPLELSAIDHSMG